MLGVLLGGIFLLCALFLLFGMPRQVLMGGLKHFDSKIPFEVQRVNWKSAQQIVLYNVQFGDFIKARKATLRFKYEDFAKGHIAELRVEYPEILLDLSRLDQLNGNTSIKVSELKLPIHLDKLIVERGKLTVKGLARGLPPVDLDVEGEFPDVPLGSETSRGYLDKVRLLTLRNLVLYSPLDLTVPLVRIPELELRFTMGGIQEHRLETLAFRHPTLSVDRGLFWFVERLRAARGVKQKKAAAGPNWIVRSFEITDGKLDITRLKEMNLGYSFPFEFGQENMNLNQLNLAESRFQLTVPNQDVPWNEKNIFFKNLHGKIAFHMSATESNAAPGAVPIPAANDLVNTLYVDAVRWKEMEMKSCWLALTFDTNSITSAYGGSFADGYINGGTTCGWSGKESWRIWGAAANIDTGKISHDFKNESFSIDGRAGGHFDMEGKTQKLQAVLKLDSNSAGLIQISALDRLLERVQQNTIGLKRELLQTFIQSLRNYPYDSYSLRADYQRPDVTLAFRAKGKAGVRDLDMNWHGLSSIETFGGSVQNATQSK